MNETLEGLVLLSACGYCDADADAWCRTKSGRLATHLHSGRSWPILQAYWMGCQETDEQMRDWLKKLSPEEILALRQRLLEGKRW